MFVNQSMLTGSIVALVTPMDYKGNVCRSSLKQLIDYHVANGTSAIVSVGTTGEYSTLSHEEHLEVVSMTIELANGRIPVIAGTGSNSTAEAIIITQSFHDIGVVGCLTVTPYYNIPSQEGLFQHFKAIAENTNLPQILYNVPYRTGCDMLPKTVSRLANIKNIIAIKEATADLNRIRHIKKLVSEDFILLSGDDATALDFMQLGGHGVISVTSNIAALDMAEMCKLAAAGNFKKARIINQRLTPLHKNLFIETNPCPVKWACKKLGLLNTDTLRLPLTPISYQSREKLTSALKYAGLL